MSLAVAPAAPDSPPPPPPDPWGRLARWAEGLARWAELVSWIVRAVLEKFATKKDPPP